MKPAPITSGTRGRRLVAAIGCLLGGLAVTAGVPAAAVGAEQRPTCKRAGSRTVVKNDLARVFEVSSRGGRRLYGCLYSVRRRVLLETEFDDEYVSSASYRLVRLGGRFVAWSYESTDVSCKADCPPNYQPTRQYVKVYDLRRRRVREVGDSALNLAVTASGAVAWARAVDPATVEVRASDATGTHVLDSGNIPPESLSAELTIVSWLKDGLERFARLR